MRRARRWLSASALLAAVCGLARLTVAQDGSDLERAKASFKAGANAYAAGDFPAAIQALEAAYELTPLPAIAFSLAQAERKQYGVKHEREHLLRSLTLFRRYLEQEPNGARKNDALLALAELGPKVESGTPSEAPIKLQTRPTRLMIVSDTPGARITLDGGPLSASPLIREVAPGKHHAHVQASGYEDVERDVTAVAGELLLNEVRLTERPTSLYVWAPAGADIYVDGVYMAQGGPLATIPLALGAHQLTVGQKGRRVVRRDLQLERGRAHTEVVTLEPTTQRSLSELLFIGGGVALGAGVVLSAFAVRSEDRAEDFLQRKVHHQVELSELVAYNASLAERARFRSAAAIGVAGSLGFFITGLFLHELDQPRSPAAPRRDEMTRRESAWLEPRVSFSPLTATGDFGASLDVSF
jgi:tetratricopeptide (TPR) repeat protein